VVRGFLNRRIADRSKRATGRPKDRLTLPEIEALREIGTRIKRPSGSADAQSQGSAKGGPTDQEPDD